MFFKNVTLAVAVYAQNRHDLACTTAKDVPSVATIKYTGIMSFSILFAKGRRSRII